MHQPFERAPFPDRRLRDDVVGGEHLQLGRGSARSRRASGRQSQPCTRRLGGMVALDCGRAPSGHGHRDRPSALAGGAQQPARNTISRKVKDLPAAAELVDRPPSDRAGSSGAEAIASATVGGVRRAGNGCRCRAIRLWHPAARHRAKHGESEKRSRRTGPVKTMERPGRPTAPPEQALLSGVNPPPRPPALVQPR